METKDSNDLSKQELQKHDSGINMDDPFQKYYGAALGIGAAILGYVAMALIAGLIIWGGWKGYQRWFGNIDGIEIGHKGLIYDYRCGKIIKTYPHRTILSHVDKLYNYKGDTIDVIVHYGKYGLLNLNTAQFIIPAEYENLWKSSEDNCLAFRGDSMYTIGMFDGIISDVEYIANLYYNVRPLFLDMDEHFDNCSETYNIDEDKILLYEYSDHKGRKGLMNKDLVPITPALYRVIYPLKEDMFFCQFYGGDDNVPGVILDNKGNRIK